MRPFLGMALGAAFVPAMVALVVGFGAVALRFDLDRVDTVTGCGVAFGLLVIGVSIAMKVLP